MRALKIAGLLAAGWLSGVGTLVAVVQLTERAYEREMRSRGLWDDERGGYYAT